MCKNIYFTLQEMDIALMSLSFTPNRQQIMDFSYPVEYSSVRITTLFGYHFCPVVSIAHALFFLQNRLLIRKDWQNNELKWTAYTDPFHWGVWLAIPLTVALGVVAFTVFTQYKLMNSTPAGSAWLLSLCFLQQGGKSINATAFNRCLSGRLLIFLSVGKQDKKSM